MEQVDAFTEGYFDGSIITPLARKDLTINDFQLQTLTYQTKAIPELAKLLGKKTVSWGDFMDRLVVGRLADYSALRSNPGTCSSPKTLELASTIFEAVVILRSKGLIQNNPESLKTLDYFKVRCDQLQKENEMLHKNLVNAYQVNEELQARLGDKARDSRQLT